MFASLPSLIQFWKKYVSNNIQGISTYNIYFHVNRALPNEFRRQYVAEKSIFITLFNKEKNCMKK